MNRNYYMALSGRHKEQADELADLLESATDEAERKKIEAAIRRWLGPGSLVLAALDLDEEVANV